MRSKPASNSSPATGDAPDRRAEAKPSARHKGNEAVELEVSRQRSLSWTVIGGVLGGLLIWKLGTVGVWGGFVLVALAAYHAWNLIQTFLHPAGTIVVTDGEVSLPRGLCMPRPVKAARNDVTAVYFLRRSVPWNHAAPVLVIELGDKAMAFPRDWFASEADQRRVVHALLRDTSKPDAKLDAKPDAKLDAKPDDAKLDATTDANLDGKADEPAGKTGATTDEPAA